MSCEISTFEYYFQMYCWIIFVCVALIAVHFKLTSSLYQHKFYEKEWTYEKSYLSEKRECRNFPVENLSYSSTRSSNKLGRLLSHKLSGRLPATPQRKWLASMSQKEFYQTDYKRLRQRDHQLRDDVSGRVE